MSRSLRDAWSGFYNGSKISLVRLKVFLLVLSNSRFIPGIAGIILMYFLYQDLIFRAGLLEIKSPIIKSKQYSEKKSSRTLMIIQNTTR